MRKEEITVITFILRHAAEYPAREAGEVLYALAAMTSNNATRNSLFERAKEIEGVRENLQENADRSLMDSADEPQAIMHK
jgi:hypothetical protein